eukprot:tig00021617_g22928.t1
MNGLSRSASDGRVGPGLYDAPTSFGPRSFAPVFRIIPPPRDAWKKVEDVPPPGKYNPGFKLLERKVSTPSIRKDNIGRAIDYTLSARPEKKPDPGQYFVMRRVGASGDSGPAYTISPESVSAQEAIASRHRQEAGPPPGTYNPKSLGMPRPRTALLRLSESRICDLASPVPGAALLSRPETPGPGAYVPPTSIGTGGPSFSFSYTDRFDFTAAAAKAAGANGGGPRRRAPRVIVTRVATRRLRRSASAGEGGLDADAPFDASDLAYADGAPGEPPGVDYVEGNKEEAARYTAELRRLRIEAGAEEVEERIRVAQERKREQLEAFLRHKAVLARRAFRDEALVARERRQREWAAVVAHAARLRLLCSAIQRLRQERLEQARLQARLRFVRRFAMRWWTRVRLKHAEKHMEALNKFVRVARLRIHIVRKRRAAGVLRDFFAKMGSLGEITRAVKTCLARVRLIQRTWRDFRAAGEVQVRLVRLQWDALDAESEEEEEGLTARSAKGAKKKKKKPAAAAAAGPAAAAGAASSKKKGAGSGGAARSPSRARKRGQADVPAHAAEFEIPLGIKYNVIKESLRARRKKHVEALKEWARGLPKALEEVLHERRRRELIGEEDQAAQQAAAEEQEAARDAAAAAPDAHQMLHGLYEQQRTGLEIATDLLPPHPAHPSGPHTARKRGAPKQLRIDVEHAAGGAGGGHGGRAALGHSTSRKSARGTAREEAQGPKEPLSDGTWWARAMRMDSRQFERWLREDPARRLPPSLRAPLFYARLQRLQLEKLVAFAQTYAREMAHWKTPSVNFSLPSSDTEY